MNGVPVTIVGVSPRGFTGMIVGEPADISIAVAALPRLEPGPYREWFPPVFPATLR